MKPISVAWCLAALIVAAGCGDSEREVRDILNAERQDRLAAEQKAKDKLKETFLDAKKAFEEGAAASERAHAADRKKDLREAWRQYVDACSCYETAKRYLADWKIMDPKDPAPDRMLPPMTTLIGVTRDQGHSCFGEAEAREASPWGTLNGKKPLRLLDKNSVEYEERVRAGERDEEPSTRPQRITEPLEQSTRDLIRATFDAHAISRGR